MRIVHAVRRLVCAVTAAVALAPAGHAVAAEPKVRIALVAETAGAVPGATVHVALKQTITPGWHTYWRNPGDSGEATTIRWTLPAGWRAGEIIWPTPERQQVAPTIVNYGYNGEVLLPTPVEVPADAAVGERVTLTAAASWLVCSDICIPEQGVASLTLPVVAGRPTVDRRDGEAVRQALAAAPRPVGLTASFDQVGGRLRLAAVGPELTGVDLAGTYFFPFDGSALNHSGSQAIERGAEGLTLSLEPGYAFQGSQPPSALSGVLALASGRAFELTATPGPPPAGAHGLGPPPARASDGEPLPAEQDLGLPLALMFALLGGLILNLMPCVFPILSMKAAALAGHAHEQTAARGQALAFGAGVLATFLLLGGAVVALQSAGQAVGWGFQLQSPAVVAGLALLMLLVALNLSGVFHAGGGVQNLGGEAAAGRGGASGAFLTGVLAVVVAAPCTAPFMAGAMGFALTQPAPVTLLIFAALAVGFALPFVLLGFSPALLRRLPRPGPWMEGLRRLLALPMYGTALWLAWVFAQQAGEAALAGLFAGGLLTAFAAWLWGVRQRSGGPRAPLATAALAALAAAVVAPVLALRSTPPESGEGASIETARAVLPGEPFTPERLAALRAEGRPVFVNLTADWCVTCKVNEASALSSARVAQAFREHQVAYLVGDWTRRDAVIARTLAEHGRAGVPLYLVYAPGVDRPAVLPQLLTEGMVVAAVREAAAARATAAVKAPART